MDVVKLLKDEEKAKEFFRLSLAFAAGSITSSLIGIVEFKIRTKKLRERIQLRNEMVRNYREEIRRIQNDVTLSGTEREEKIEVIIKFVELILDQPIN